VWWHDLLNCIEMPCEFLVHVEKFQSIFAEHYLITHLE